MEKKFHFIFKAWQESVRTYIHDARYPFGIYLGTHANETPDIDFYFVNNIIICKNVCSF